MKAFIISYNRLSPLKAMCEFLEKTGCTPIIIDNGSTYPPLLDWLFDCHYEVHVMYKNCGHQVLWNEMPRLITDRYYIVTDHDLDLSMIPHDYIDHLKQGLELFPHVIKAGFGLRIDDLPENDYTKDVISWEKKFWQTRLQNGFYHSDIDTTFAMYDKTRDFGELPNNRFFSAVRSADYVCRHLPWYNTKDNLTDEEKYYLEHTGTYWAGKFKELI